MQMCPCSHRLCSRIFGLATGSFRTCISSFLGLEASTRILCLFCDGCA